MSVTEEQEALMKQKYEMIKEEGSPLEKLRAYCMSRGVCGIRNIGSIFRRFDQNGDKNLDLQEFKDAIEECGIAATPAMQHECFSEIDLDGSGKINFDEFLIALRPPLSERRLEVINMAFDKLDRLGSGVVTVDDLRGVYSAEYHPKYQNGEWTEDEVFVHWLQQFGGAHDGMVRRDDFVNYYVGVSSSIDDDEYFEVMMKQAWHLDI